MMHEGNVDNNNNFEDSERQANKREWNFIANVEC